MKTFEVELESTKPYSSGRYYDEAIAPKASQSETKAQYDDRTWRHRCNTVDGTLNSKMFIPAMAFKNALDSAASYRSESVPGKQRAKFGKHFAAGVMIEDDLVLPIKACDVEGVRLFVPADGKRGSGSRVTRTFPIIRSWKGSIRVVVLDDCITQDVLERHMETAGLLVGVGRWRPQSHGNNGRFRVVSIAEVK